MTNKNADMAQLRQRLANKEVEARLTAEREAKREIEFRGLGAQLDALPKNTAEYMHPANKSHESPIVLPVITARYFEL